ncbi:MAG: pyridoxamine 5'-phosphate oxidase family protein [Oscillospiraceae bacterium]|nr:pyridoxamine 5'-phosphate oxidase family protein [Oscillospiraceae bacterium]
MSIQKILEQFGGPFFLATVEQGEPRVRPLGLILEYEGRLYLGLGSQKAGYRQLLEQPALELSAVDANKNWLRIRGEAVFDDSPAVLAAVYEKMPHLEAQYSASDGPRLKPFYIKNGVAEIASLSGEFQSFTF